MRNVLIGVTGSIAACKVPELVKKLIGLNFSVKVVLTQNAKQFVTPIGFEHLDAQAIYAGWTANSAKSVPLHITLAQWADLIVIAPASANFIAKLAHGLADDLLSTLCLASVAPICVFPAMNTNMWNNLATQSNITLLKNRSIKVLEPSYGRQACGSIGVGRMQEIEEILSYIVHSNEEPFFKWL